MMAAQVTLDEYPALSALVDQIDSYLETRHADFFGLKGYHPVLPVKRAKVVHDSLWGTNRFSWQELVLIDSPILQRLRGIHQVGLSCHVYPSAHHTRFEHCLGVVTIASRVFQALLQRNAGEMENVVRIIYPGSDPRSMIARLRQELRLAALLHDTGHSLYSHVSERVYENLDVLAAASSELSSMAGKRRGAAEAISFCFALTESVRGLLERARRSLIGDTAADDYNGEISLANVALMIVGRGIHPYLQFLGDIVSSGFDADKLDYLLRDAAGAGLPLRYDLDRYLYAVRLEKDVLADGDGSLAKLYTAVSPVRPERKSPQGDIGAPFYETYRLRLPRAAMNTIEQIIICKMMLFSYLYHHPKVRAAEGMLERVLKRLVDLWRAQGKTDKEILELFLDMTDSDLRRDTFVDSKDGMVKQNSYRIANRLLPREVYRLGGDVATHAEGALLTVFLNDLQKKEKRDRLVAELESAIGEELLKIKPGLAKTSRDALDATGIWVDVPKAPDVEDIEKVIRADSRDTPGIPLKELFPISQWKDAYLHFRYYVRLFAFSEFCAEAEEAGRLGMQRVIGIQGNDFYKSARRSRT
jgi:HD superfamily phosphohydrolase